MICPYCKHNAVACADANAERGEGAEAEMEALQRELADARAGNFRLANTLLDKLDLIGAVRAECDRTIEEHEKWTTSHVLGGGALVAVRILAILDKGEA